MPTVRPASADDLPLVARIMAEGFYADPVMSWAIPDDTVRLGKLTTMFTGLAGDMFAPRGVIHLADAAAVALWREPTFDHAAEAEAADEAGEFELFTAEEGERFDALTAAMRLSHPNEPHWYLNVVSALPSHQGQGLGAAALAPVLVQADDAGMPCYLESTNPRNRTLYRRNGFEDLHQLDYPGPDMLAMWRPPR